MTFYEQFSRYVTGLILMVETVTVPIVDGILDSGVTRWKENVSDDNSYAYILRVYCTDTRESYPSTHRIGLNLLDEFEMKIKEIHLCHAQFKFNFLRGCIIGPAYLHVLKEEVNRTDFSLIN